MTTNDERREVAAKLRDMACRTNPSWPALMDLLKCRGRAVAVMYLADLIEPEERMCRLTYDTVHDDMVCSSCGAWLDMIAYSELETSGQMRYCPNCGAEVAHDA